MKRFKLHYLIPLEVLCLVLLAVLCFQNSAFRERFLNNLPFVHTPSPTPPVTEYDGPYPTLPQYTIEESYETTSDGKNFIKLNCSHCLPQTMAATFQTIKKVT